MSSLVFGDEEVTVAIHMETSGTRNTGAATPIAVTRRVEITGTSVVARLFGWGSRLTVRPVIAAWATEPRLPWPACLVDAVAGALPGLAGTRNTSIRLRTCRAEWIAPAKRSAETEGRALLYTHGGGFMAGGLNTHRRLAARIGRSCGADVLAVDYRMLPRHSIDEAIEDGLDGYLYLLGRGYAPQDIVIAGDSAGGFLAFSVALAARDRGLPLPGAIVGLSPLTDLDPRGKLAHPNADRCAVIPAAALRRLVESSDRADARRGGSDRISPVDADLRGLPPVLIQVGSTEMIVADAELMALRLAAAGVDCELQVWDNQLHVFHIVADAVPEAARAIEAIGTWYEQIVSHRAEHATVG